MRRNVQKWGNSLAVRIPAPMALECGLTPGATVEMESDGERIVLTPRRSKVRRYDLRHLVAQITRANRPVPTEFGRRRGREVW